MFGRSLVDVKIQKNRGYKFSKKIDFFFGEYAFVTSNESKMELIHFSFLKKWLKKLNIKKKNDKNKNSFKNFKIWLFLIPNYVFSKKSKNSRMGKGKGSFDRWVFRVQRGSKIAEFCGVSVYRLKKIASYLNKKFKLKFSVVKKTTEQVYCDWSNQSTNLEIFNKYRYM